MKRTYYSHSVRDTAKISRVVASQVGSEGATILIYGELGAGKTEFVRGLVEAVGGDVSEVSSPTFVLMQEYLVRHKMLERFTTDSVFIDDQDPSRGHVSGNAL